MTINDRDDELQGHEDDFIGKPALLDKHYDQVEAFERWARVGDWRRFHSRHYDWWAFP